MIYDYTKEQLIDYFLEIGEKKYRALQVYEWLYKQKVKSFDEMTNLSKSLRDKLLEVGIPSLKMLTKQESVDGTIKFLFELSDGSSIETVLMTYEWGNSLCITTQVGCSIGCSFCASGLYGKTRDLSTGEIILQVLEVERILNIKITNIVVMGIGEPFDNYDNTMDAVKILNDPKAFEIGARHITISTSGIIPGIEKFSDEGLQVNLALSLHAPNDKLRSELMKINNAYSLRDVMKTIKTYVKKTNRRITFEYILLKGVNDSVELANELSNLIRGINCYVNLIPFNPVADFDYKRTPKKDALMFYDILKKRGINVTLRQEKGTDILAACGQLRQKTL